MLVLVDFGEIVTFIAMAIASILAVAVGAERTLLYNVNSAERNDNFLTEIIEKFRNRDLDGANALVKNHKDNVYTRFAAFVLEHYSKGASALKDMMAGKVLKERIELERRLPILNTLGNNAPFIGLLGTVLGVIKAFYNLGALGNSGAEVVMKSISIALLATAAGLLIAIPVVMLNNFFTKKLKVIDQNLEILTREILASISAIEPKTPRKKAETHTTQEQE